MKSIMKFLTNPAPIDVLYTHFNSSKDTIFGLPKFGPRKAKKAEALKVSTFLPNKFADILKTLPKDHYVICVQYTAGDVQIGITGAKDASDASYSDAAIREVFEEVRMVKSDLKEVDRAIFPKFENVYYVGNLGTPAAFTPSLPTEKPADGVQRKVAVLIHGTRDEVKAFIGQMSRGNGQLNDNICSLVAVPVPDAVIIADLILAGRKNTPKGMKHEPFWYSVTTHGMIRDPTE